MRLKKLAVAIAFAIASSSTLAANAVLVNQWVKAGVNETTGTFGSGGNTPPGLQYDSTGTGTFNNAYDYLTPGSPFDGFTVRLENSSNGLVATYTNNNAGTLAQVAGAWVGSTSSSSAVWEGSNSYFTLRNSYSLPSGQQYVDINTRITAAQAIANLYFGRFIDPDARAATGDSSATDNVLGYGAIPRKNVAFSEALVSRYALGLYTGQNTGSYGAGISPGWSTNPKDYLNNTNGVNAVRGDYTIGLGFAVSGLSAGDIVNFQYAYIFGPSAFGAASEAVSGGAGGGTPGTTPSGATLTDVGSATSASTSSPPVSAGPTVTGTSTTNTVTHVDSTGTPVVTTVTGTPTVTTSGLESTSTQTTTVTTYTPITRTTTTTPVTTTTYSDSTTTTSSGTAVVTTSDVSTTSVTATTTVVATVIDTALPVVTGSVAHHTASDNGKVQTIARETTTTVTTPLTQTTTVTVVTNGVTTSSSSSVAELQNVATSVANDSASGRIDQHTVLNKINKGLNRSLDMNAFRTDGATEDDVTVYINGGSSRSTAHDGYSARSSIYGVAVEKKIDSDWRLGVQYNRGYSKLAGVDSTTTQNKDHLGLFSVYDIEDWKLVTNLGYARNTASGSRQIVDFDFTNGHSTNGYDLWVSNKLYTPNLEGFRPFVGATVSKSHTKGYTESGSIQSARSVEAVSTTNNYAEAGVRYDQTFDDLTLSGELSTTTDSYKKADVSVAYKINKDSVVSLSGQRSLVADTATNTVFLAVNIKF